VTNEDHRQIAGELRQKLTSFNSVNSEIVEQKCTKFGHDVARLLPLNLLKRIYDRLIRCQMQTVKVVPRDVNCIGCANKKQFLR